MGFVRWQFFKKQLNFIFDRSDIYFIKFSKIPKQLELLESDSSN